MIHNIRPLHVGKFVPPPYAGVEAHVDTLLRTLTPIFECTLVAAESPASNINELNQFPYRLLTAKSYGKLASVKLSPGILQIVKEEINSKKCNLLHIHAPNPWGDLAALTCAHDVPVVMTWHSDIVRQRNLLKVYRYIQRRVLDRVDKIIVFTPKHYDSSEQLHQLNVGPKISFAPIGIDFDKLDRSLSNLEMVAELDDFSRGRPMLLTVGRHVYYKGYQYLLAAMKELRSDTVLVMVGTGVETDALKRQAKELQISNRILFLGEVDHAKLVSAFHRCDVFCLPSIEPSEAFGIASAEAMACGKPTIVCELGNGVNYLNQSGKTGLTVPPRDVPALADAIDSLMLDEGLRIRMGSAANNWVRSEFSISAMRDGTTRIYTSIF